MGADLLLHHVWIARGQTPDWMAAKAVLEALTDDQINAFEESAYVYADDQPGYRERLIADLDEIHDAWDHDRRTAYKCPLGPIDVLITGGISWGDSPDEFFDVVGRFLETPAVEAAGFFVWPPVEV